MTKKFIMGLLAASLFPVAHASAQQTPANLDAAITEFTRICMADQTQYFDTYAQAETSCACSLGMAGGYFDVDGFISYLVLLQELLKYDDLGSATQYNSFVDGALARGFDEAELAAYMTAAEELGAIEEAYCSAYW